MVILSGLIPNCLCWSITFWDAGPYHTSPVLVSVGELNFPGT